jgi:cobaltochelatase CobS
MTTEARNEALTSTIRRTVRESLERLPLKTGVWSVVHATGAPDMDACIRKGNATTTHYKHLTKQSLIDLVCSTAIRPDLLKMEAAIARAEDMVATGQATKPIGKPSTATPPKADHPMDELKPDDESAALAMAIRNIAKGATPSLDIPAVKDLIAKEIAKVTMPRQVEIKVADAPAVNVGVQHPEFGNLCKTLNARIPNGRRLNVWLFGPPATGKTTAAEKVAEALSLKFYAIGCIETGYAVLGYNDSHGKLVRTPFREAWEHGGVMLFDEADGNQPNAACAINGAVDGTVCAFPDGMIKRHPDCVIVAAGNTNGRGGNAKFSGRMKQDGAFINRWTFMEWNHDDNLETAMTGTDELATKWLKTVRAYRKAAKGEKVEGLDVTTRSSLDGVALLRAGLTEKFAIDATIRKGLPATSWDRVHDRATNLMRGYA